MSERTANFRYQDVREIREDELRRRVPSVFQRQRHPESSERFIPIATIDVLQALRREGFAVIRAGESPVRVDGRRGYNKHLITLRQIDGVKAWSHGNDLAIFDIDLVNANDGSSVYKLMAALWRKLCDNGLMVSTDTVEHLKVKHIGDMAKNVVEASMQLLAQHGAVFNTIEEWKHTQLDSDERVAYAEAAHKIRFGSTSTLVKPHQLLIPRRTEDVDGDLWTTMNVAQENMMRGGIVGHHPTPQARMPGGRRPDRQRTTRPVKAIDTTVKVNTLLWAFTKRLADIKAGRAVVPEVTDAQFEEVA
jgi:Domain of unknown function (DUF932)